MNFTERNLTREKDVVAAMKSKMICRAGRVWKAQEQMIYEVIEWILMRKRPLGGPRDKDGWMDRTM